MKFDLTPITGHHQAWPGDPCRDLSTCWDLSCGWETAWMPWSSHGKTTVRGASSSDAYLQSSEVRTEAPASMWRADELSGNARGSWVPASAGMTAGNVGSSFNAIEFRLSGRMCCWSTGVIPQTKKAPANRSFFRSVSD